MLEQVDKRLGTETQKLTKLINQVKVLHNLMKELLQELLRQEIQQLLTEAKVSNTRIDKPAQTTWLKRQVTQVNPYKSERRH